MKKLSLFLLLSLLFSCSRMSSTVELSGELEHGNGRMLHLSVLTAEGLQPVDSAVVRHNSFRFKLNSHKVKCLKEGEPVFLQLSFTPDNGLTTLARGGENVHFKADANQLVSSYSVTGPEDALLMWELDSALAVFVAYTDTLLQIYNYYMIYDSARSMVERRYNQAVAVHRQYLREFITEHPQSFSTMIAFYQEYDNCRFFNEKEDAVLLRSLTDSLAKYYPNSQYVRWLQSRIR